MLNSETFHIRTLRSMFLNLRIGNDASIFSLHVLFSFSSLFLWMWFPRFIVLSSLSVFVVCGKFFFLFKSWIYHFINLMVLCISTTQFNDLALSFFSWSHWLCLGIWNHMWDTMTLSFVIWIVDPGSFWRQYRRRIA